MMPPKTRQRLVDLLRELNTQRQVIAEAMTFCMDNWRYASEITIIIAQSFQTDEGTPTLYLSRLYLLSDILHNGANRYKYVYFILPMVFEGLPPSL